MRDAQATLVAQRYAAAAHPAAQGEMAYSDLLETLLRDEMAG